MNVITLYIVFITLGIFVVFLVIVILYLLTSLLLRRIEYNKVEDEKQSMLKILNNIMKQGAIKGRVETIKLKNSFSNKIKVQAFYLAYIEYVEENGYSERLKNLLNESVDYKKILTSKVVRKDYIASYVLYLISQFRLSTKEVGEYALKKLSHRSVYVRNNAVNVIKHFEQVDIVLKALKTINSNEDYFNDKILIDFLDSFKGEMNLLDRELLESFNEFEPNIKKIIIEHFRNMKSDSLVIKDKMLEILSNSKENEEILISATKYFSKVIDKDAGVNILNNMDSNNWALRAISASVISNYNGENAIEKLKEKLSDKNYFVRYNSAISFVNLEKEDLVIEEAFENEDRFARETLLYAIDEKGILSFDEYKSILNREELKAK